MTSAVIISIRVRATPHRAFEAFTRDIGAWWRANPLFPLTARGDGCLRFEPGEGGRLVTRLADGADIEIGRVTIWQPGERLALSWRQAAFGPDEATEVDVRFEALGDETRITVAHRGWDRFAPSHAARHGMALMLFQHRLAAHWRARLGALRSRLSPGEAAG
ncbi:SRPBCC domain-containing protein [Novosphingobium album (ex Liu et al. 2023)]|uniref:SRPBCC domain-containing protein n=1 Tax=Novosphingobium album (ex Liu et al. 2023) TaxID=3031130 RepID=A0ABT5WT37_9SPHN|nr:SRPBCC domain-containing protein [Novosphingobium album (ex Liu et al. 2023)]MDE8653069.1 SRPBCC domain-containing protein [Novosphingobium album (ex Liu et al. 2023)]